MEAGVAAPFVLGGVVRAEGLVLREGADVAVATGSELSVAGCREDGCGVGLPRVGGTAKMQHRDVGAPVTNKNRYL